jgi:hypothetical protein
MVAIHGFPASQPFPPLPAHLGDAYRPGELRLRRYGTQRADLELDFRRPAPELITAIIAACTERLDGAALEQSFFAELSVSTRIVCLLLLARLDGVDTLSAPLVCPAFECGERYEVDLTLAEILAFAQTENAEPITVDLGESRVSLRKPTGHDQMAWQSGRFPDVAAARLTMLRSLALSDLPHDLGDPELARIEAALDESDPLVCFSLTAACPSCEAEAGHEIALADMALQVLRAAQSRLIESVHALASRYGWSETAVLEIPDWRRQRYLSLIGWVGA